MPGHIPPSNPGLTDASASADITRLPVDADRAAEGSAQRLSEILLAMETGDARTFRLMPLAAGTIPVVTVCIDDRVWRISPADARTLGQCLTWDGGGRYSRFLASLFDSAACDAEALACPVASARRQALEASGAA